MTLLYVIVGWFAIAVVLLPLWHWFIRRGDSREP